MSIVSEVYDALLEAGASEAKAKAAAAAIPVAEHLATKEDIAELKAEIAGLKVAMFTFGPLILGGWSSSCSSPSPSLPS